MNCDFCQKRIDPDACVVCVWDNDEPESDLCLECAKAEDPRGHIGEAYRFHLESCDACAETKT